MKMMMGFISTLVSLRFLMTTTRRTLLTTRIKEVQVHFVSEDKFEEIISYNKDMQHIEKNNDDGKTFWKYKRISGHECPLNKNPSLWKGDKYNVKVEWENGEVSYEPLHTIASNDPVVMCAIYGKYHALLDTDG
jgi:hypothetical protein